jgi:hypothetical protein
VTLSFSVSRSEGETSSSAYFPLSLSERKGGQASSEDLLPLGYGERERAGVRVKLETIPLTLTLSLQGRENNSEEVIAFVSFESSIWVLPI